MILPFNNYLALLLKPRLLPLPALFLSLFLNPLPTPRLGVNKTQKMMYKSSCLEFFEKNISGGGQTLKPCNEEALIGD